jgi:hypothetical protein
MKGKSCRDGPVGPGVAVNKMFSSKVLENPRRAGHPLADQV